MATVESDIRERTIPAQQQHQPYHHHNTKKKPDGGDGLAEDPEHAEMNARYKELMGEMGFGAVSALSQSVLTHPLLVFRNQCQLNPRTEVRYHIVPWTVAMPLYHMQRNQGFVALWKGIASDFYVATARKVVEMVITDNTSLPLTPSTTSAVSSYSKHLLLKTISATLVSPLMCASYILRVQSQVVVSDQGYFAVFGEGYNRMLSTFSAQSETSHLLPLWRLVVPLTALSVSHHIINSMAVAAVTRQYHRDALSLTEYPDHDEVPLIKDLYDRYFPRLLGALSGKILSDVCLYPLSTITGRLIVQGTRIIIDDTDSGNAVLPVNTSYTGMFDCLHTIIKEEGLFGLYKGFGALLMQYTVQALILRGMHVLYEKVMEVHYPRVPRRKLFTQSSVSSAHSSLTSLNTTMASLCS